MITWEDYNKRSTDLYIQFDLARKALHGFSDTPEALEKYAKRELDDLQQDMKVHLEKKGKDPHDYWMFKEDGTNKFVNETINSVHSQLEILENRLNQNHLILLVTLFESFMKDIHNEILKRNPKLLDLDRKIPLGKIMSLGMDKIIEEEISREIYSLDRKSIEDRCKYFKDKFSIDWSFDGTALPIIKSSLNTRNIILHEDPDYRVNHFELKSAMLICMGITSVAIVQAHLLFPESFEALSDSSKLEEHFREKLKL